MAFGAVVFGDEAAAHVVVADGQDAVHDLWLCESGGWNGLAEEGAFFPEEAELTGAVFVGGVGAFD